MNSTNLFKVYSSSAGSGKTFTLAIEYIRLVIVSNDPFYFRKILAVTFTNDAANEMKIRILEYLELLSNENIIEPKNADKRSLLIETLLKELPTEIDLELIKARSNAAFYTIIHHYSDFSVSTIDSFIQKIISGFAMQLGYNNQIEVILDANEILLPATESFISKVGSDTEETLSEAIINYVNQLADEGKSWNNLPKSFADFAKSLFSDSKIKYLDKIQDLPLESLRVISNQIFDYLENSELGLIELANNFKLICYNKGLVNSDFFQTGKGILASFEKRANRVNLFDKFNSYVQKAKNDDVWYKAKSPKAEFIDAIKTELLAILVKYEEIVEVENSKYILLKAISKNLFKLSLLRQFKFEIENLKAENGIVHISEFNKAILNVVANEPVPYIYERIGEKFNHIMIDEFQDTSPIQFQNFLPLFSNSLTQGLECLVVGDPKQAIYRFRGGDMSQIINLYNRNLEALSADLNPDSFLVDHILAIGPHLIPKNLSINYRSFSEIIDFNNDLFMFIKNHEPFLREFKLLGKTFNETFSQTKPEKVPSGAHIEIIFKNIEAEKLLEDNFQLSESESETNEDEPNFVKNKSIIEDPKIIEIINKSIDDGFEYKDIAILCRKNDVAKILANYLNNNNIPIISADSILLSFSNNLNFLMDIVEIVASSNQLIRYQAIVHFHKFILNSAIPNNEGEINQLVENESVTQILEYFNSFGFDASPQIVQNSSLYELAEYLIFSFKLLENKAEQEYLYAFLDEIIKFKSTKTDNILEFLNFWNENKSKISISPSQSNSITITTIHKAKGLQYPIVIIPEATWGLKIKYYDQVWVHLDEVNYHELTDKELLNDLPIASLNASSQLKKTEIHTQYDIEEELYFLEAINLLYVALTRAEQRLYILTRHTIKPIDPQHVKKDAKPENEASIQNIGNLFYYFLKDKVVFVDESFNYVLSTGIKNQAFNESKIVFQTKIPASYFNLENKKSISSKGEISYPYDDQNREKGNQIHEVLSKLGTIDDIEWAVNQGFNSGLISESEIGFLTAQLTTLVNLPLIADCFVEGVKYKNEMDILLPSGKTQRPDRVNFFKNKTVIIDYKSGVERKEHRQQIKIYCDLLREMSFPKIETYIVYLEEMDIIKVY